MKQMFDISEKLIVGQSDEIHGVTPINWEDSSWRQYLWSVMKKSSVYRMHKFMFFFFFFRFCVMCLERWIWSQHQILFGNNSWVGSKIHHNTELWTQLMVSRWSSSGIFSQESPHCSSATKSKSSCLKWVFHQNLKDESSSCRCSMTSCGDLKTMNRNAMLTPHLWLYLQEDSYQEHGHS